MNNRLACLILLISFTTMQAHAQRAKDTQGPLYIENRGQWEADARFLLRSSGLDVWICQDRVVYDVGRSNLEDSTTSHSIVTSRFVGANISASVRGTVRMKSTHAYYIGDDPTKWATGVPLYSGVEIKDLYDGIDLAFYVDAGRPRYDIVVAPHADPTQYTMRLEGVNDVRLDEKGSLIVITPSGELRVQELFAYQMRNETHEYVPCSFVRNDDGTIRFAVGDYDPSLPLVIDPITVSYCTFLGGNDNDGSSGIAVSSDGDVYITGRTPSADFPTGKEGLPAQGGKTIYVSKLKQVNGSPVDLEYTVFIGGSGIENASGIAIDGSRNIYITGETFSKNFPLLHAYQTDQPGTDAFVVKFSEDNSGAVSLAFSTYVGGSAADQPLCITVDANRNVFIAGSTVSTDFPTKNEYQKDQTGDDAFVAKLSQTGNDPVVLEFATYIGGSGRETISDIAVDSFGNMYIAGSVESTDFPTVNQYQTDQPQADGFVAKITQQGSTPATLAFSTYLGGDDIEAISDVLVDANANIFIAGRTRSSNFPSKLPLQPSGGDFDVFVTKLRQSGGPVEIVFSTFLGGNGAEGIGGMTMDADGNMYIAGSTPSPDFPILHQFQNDQPQSDVYIAKLSQSGQSPVTLVYSTYLGGDTLESAGGIAIDQAGNAYVSGFTASSNFPSVNAFQTKSPKGDVFVAKIDAFGQGTTSVQEETTTSLPLINAATPNPTSDNLSIHFALPTAGIMSMRVFNAKGQLVLSPIAEEFRPMGMHHQTIDVSMLPSGVYSLRLITASDVATQQIVILR